MPGETKNGMQCAEFDALLSDALDHMLSGPQLERFEAHLRACPLCGPLWSEAEQGRRLLKTLAEVEAPAYLVTNILAATSGIDTRRLHAPVQPKSSWLERQRDWIAAAISPVWAVVRQPRFVMSFGMAFFSLSVALSMMGVKVNDLAKLDLRPSAIRRNYYEASGRVVKYYQNIRFVYEIESRVQELKRATTPAEPAPEEHNQKERKNNTSGQPEPKQERNYSRSDDDPALASVPDFPPVVPVTTSRRFS
jgi:Putative zinc-finger